MPETRYDDLRALVINCTLKRSPEVTHTGGLIDLSRTIMEKQGVRVDVVRAVDHDIATGVWPDMTEHGWASDAWDQRVLLHRGRAALRSALENRWATEARP